MGIELKKIEEKELLKTPVFTVVEKTFEGTDGSEMNFKPVGLNCPDWCAIVALDDQYRTIVVKQTRWGIESTTTEFPCGTVERGEEPIETAIREFKEETGITLKRNQLVKIATFNPNPAYFSNMMHVFLAEDLEDLEEILGKAEDQNLDENEDCEVFIRNLDDALVKELSISGISSAILSALFGYTSTD